MAPSNSDIAPWDTRSSQSTPMPPKAMAIFGTNADSGSASRKHLPRPIQASEIAPWETRLAHDDDIAPWERDPQAQISGSRSMNQSYFPDSIGRYDGQAASRRPDTARTNISDSPDYDGDARRPSIASATTVSSTGSRSSAANGRFHKSLKGFFGEDPTDSRKGSTANLPEQLPPPNSSEKPAQRSGSTQTQNTVEDRPKTPAPPPSSDVTPWAYQNFEDVSNFGSAPIRQEQQEQQQPQNDTLVPSSSASSQRHGLFRHRYTRSKEDPPKGQAAPTSMPKRPSTSRESSTSNLGFYRNTPQATTPMSSSTALARNASPAPSSRKETSTKSEKRGLFSKFTKSHKDKHSPQPEPTKTNVEPVRLPEEPKKPRAMSNKTAASDADNKRDRETSVASVDSASTIKASDPSPKLDRTQTASSKSSRFHRTRHRGPSIQSETSDKGRSTSGHQGPPQAGIFSLDTNLDDISDIVSQPAAPKTPGEAGIWAGKAAATPMSELSAPAWDAPDSWAVKGQEDEVLDSLPEATDDGLPAIQEEDGISYFMRVFRTDGTFATLSMSINATVGEVLQSLAKKSVLHDSIDNYQLVMRKHQLSRQLGSGERPVAMQKKLLYLAGYTERDHVEDVGREDNSYLIRFTFSHEKQTGYGSGLDKDPAFNKMQKFSHVDLSGKSLVTIPIILYTKASEIISINLSRNLALKVPKDFITACINLREIKFTGNEVWRLPPSLAWASRLTVLDVSNNRLEQLEHAELHRLMGLVSLKLANNKLSQLPPNFSYFRQLRSLNLSSNNFTTFPENICSLKSLVDLDISFNKLSSLPKIAQLTTLERLWVTNNDLKGPFNESFRSLVNLKEIDARFNAITNIDNITNLPNLEQVLVGHNSITTFKGSFPKLRVLVLDHCPITSFELDQPVPTLSSLNIASAKLVEFKETMFDYMPNLQKLNLDKNHLSNMSSQIGRLTKLEFLSMAKNPLNIVPPSIGNLGELKFLNLRECNVKSLPPEIWYCRKLETLNLSSNVLETFPKQNAAPPPNDLRDFTPTATPGMSTSPSFDDLGKLEDFQARRPSQASSGMMSIGSSPGGRKNSVASLSAHRKQSVISRTNTEYSMSTATRKDSNISAARLHNTFAGSLRYLYLADNRLEDDVFRELVLLPELRVLNLSYNELDDFPQGALRRWPQLSELYLSGNELTSLPSDDLEESSNLRILHLNANRFQVLPAELCNVHKLSTLDVGSNSLKYNVSNWPYDWNWNRNTNLKYLNFSANKRLEIKPATHQNQNHFHAVNRDETTDLTSFNTLKYLRVLGLMDVTLLTNTIPDDNEDRRVRTSASLVGALMYGMADTLGKNEHLATLDLLKPNFRGQESEILIAMFDGQTMSSGGSRVAKYLHENFSAVFYEELKKAENLKDTPIDALRRTFLAINKDMANFASSGFDTKEHRLANGHRGSTVANILGPDDLSSGGTATVLYVNGQELHVANVGDIEAILISSNGQHRQLTRKHDPAEAGERERIREAGGYVSRQGRLNDVLEVSRAFGYYSHMPSVIAAPHTCNYQITESDEIIVIATKEFWDYVTVDVAVDAARAEKNDLMLAAQKLRDLAMAFGARDKIMVMVLGISDLRKRGNHRFRGTSLSMAKELGLDEGAIFPSSRKARRKGETLVGDSRLARLEEPEPPVGDVAICFTDIKNSTALWELLPVPMRSAIMMHNELMRRQLRIIGGYEVKTEGDAFMVSFPTVTSALLWCFSCQSHLLELPWPQEILETAHCQEKLDSDQNTIYRGLSVRMGIHWGRPVCEQDPITRRMDYFGPMVNKAARVSAVADGGQITVSSDFIAEVQRTLESYADDDRRDSVGSEDTVNDDPLSVQIRRELRQLSSQGFEVKDLGEKKLKGLENPEYIYLMYPTTLASRLGISPGIESKTQPGGEPGTLGEDSQLKDLQLDQVWKLWDIALRLEMLCSCLEAPERAAGLHKPELSLLTRMKERGGVQTDAFMVNLLEHQVTRVEACATTLQLRHMYQPFQKGVSLFEQAKPIGEILSEVANLLAEVKAERSEIKTPETSEESSEGESSEEDDE
ncbi:Adenylate cyclase [Cladophialophora carrionii]|uniref:Adenylate cyclase n=1 Tax=Cladophialophora carrionii TaxID=86049 RepID=A0A1C1CYK8_9EURO|nr:Adenylate cyclase [Cladophialophora carrionii]